MSEQTLHRLLSLEAATTRLAAVVDNRRFVLDLIRQSRLRHAQRVEAALRGPGAVSDDRVTVMVNTVLVHEIESKDAEIERLTAERNAERVRADRLEQAAQQEHEDAIGRLEAAARHIDLLTTARDEYRWQADDYYSQAESAYNQMAQQRAAIATLISAGSSMRRALNTGFNAESSIAAWDEAVDSAIPDHAKPIVCKRENDDDFSGT